MSMTVAEMDTDLADAQTYLSVTRLTVDRCRHESIEETHLWIFDGKEQIGSINRLPGNPVGDYRWEVSRMYRSMPCSRRCERTLLDCIGHLMRWERPAR